MEKCVDSEYPETQYDSSKPPETWTISLTDKSNDCQEKNKSEEPGKVSKARKKIAAENVAVGGWNRSDANSKADKSVKEESKRVRKLNVLKSRLMSARRSVQNNTKTLHRLVPDRLGKFVNSSVRPETKLVDCSSIGSPSSDCSRGDSDESGEYPLKDCPETKLITDRNECLSNKESVLGNSIESDSGTNNIFEKIFDDCLGSTSIVNDASSQETLNLEADDESVAINPKTVEKYTLLLENFENFKKDDARIAENEKTPAKGERPRQSSPKAPVKVKDHNSYYSHKKIRHVCGYCHKIFKSNGKLNSHVYSHTGERPFDCNNCGKAFSSKFKLVRHLLIHSEIRKFVCQICDRTFLRNDHLKNHYKIHDPQKKMYKCPKEDCDKEYSSVMSHKKHMAYHNVEDGDLKCLICNVKFETKEEILFHLKSHSGSRLFKSQSDKKFKCDFCDRLFLTRKDVTRHLVVHTGERDFLCQFCPQQFGRKDHLVRHIKKSHLSEGMSVKREMVEKKGPKPKRKPPSTSSTSPPEDGKDKDQKTHIVITVKSPVQKKKWKSDSNAKSKSFRNDSSVPHKKQVPLSKSKSSTTQIFLQNIPNILIIPNNSIILLRNNAGKVKKTEGSENKNDVASDSNGTASFSPEAANEDRSQYPEDFLPKPSNEDSSTLFDSDLNSNYNSSMIQSQFLMNFPFSDIMSSQTEAAPFGHQFENLEMVTPCDSTKAREMASGQSETGMFSPEPSPQPDSQRKVGIVKPMTKNLSEDAEKDLFGESENLIINDSILNEFKVDDSIILDNEGGILNNIFGQGGDGTGNEFLRSLLMNENPILSPLPGFSQIFHNNVN